MNKKKFHLAVLSSTIISVSLLSGGCSSSNTTASGTTTTIPLITPLIEKAIPTGLGGKETAAFESRIQRSSPVSILTLNSSDIQTRFFSSGPTDIFQLLTVVDGLISNVNTAMSGSSAGACGTLTAITTSNFSIYPPEAPTAGIAFYGQCYLTQGTGFITYGTDGTKVYIYSFGLVESAAAIITPLDSNSNPLKVSALASASYYNIEAWLTVGYNNTPWDSGSHGVVHLLASNTPASTATSTTSPKFELTAAGVGFGYCGIQLKSDGTNVYANGSTDMGQTCAALDTLCVSAANFTTAGTCTGSMSYNIATSTNPATSTVTQFNLIPYGREGGAYESPSQTNTYNQGYTFGASTYPGGTTYSNNVIGTAGLGTCSTSGDCTNGSALPTGITWVNPIGTGDSLYTFGPLTVSSLPTTISALTATSH